MNTARLNKNVLFIHHLSCFLLVFSCFIKYKQLLFLCKIQLKYKFSLIKTVKISPFTTTLFKILFKSSSLRSFLHSVFSSFLGPNIRLRILFSNTICLRSCLNVKDHVLLLYSLTDNINAVQLNK